ncbi:hypothetical protein [Amycolatopsis thailandensis]|uniref:hypothetical protein n=1 Tax=Amycolatopsis thailandensis TaxID=589330 RepID=UPI003628AD4F
MQPSDEYYAAGLRQLGKDLVQIGAALAQRARELDGQGEPSEPFGIETAASEPPP